MVHLTELFEAYSDCAEFLFIYSGEAKMSVMGSLHQLPKALHPFAEPPDEPRGSRIHLASRVRAGNKHFGLHMTCLIDNEQCEVQELYSASPKRMLIVDTAGRIVLDSGRAPSGAFPFQEAADWLDHYSDSTYPLSTEKPDS